MQYISTTLQDIRRQLPTGVKLIAVSKFHPETAVEEAYRAGQRDFGENLVQEMTRKHEALPADIRWHFIGHLQRNKVKYIAPWVSMIHAVDSYDLLAEISKQATKYARTIPCLLQLHIAQEDTKFGLTRTACDALLERLAGQPLPGTQIVGLMGMATHTDDQTLVRSEFTCLADYFEQLKKTYFNTNDDFKELSMGMTHDYLTAIACGSTMVRIGSKIFGTRNY